MESNEFRPLFNTAYLESYDAASNDEQVIQKGFEEKFAASVGKAMEVGELLGRQIATGEADNIAASVKVGLQEIISQANGVRETAEEVLDGEEEDGGDDGDWLVDDDDEEGVGGAVEGVGGPIEVKDGNTRLHPADRLYNELIK
ncbi:hypothetical protein TrRE_jg10305 [Triparma retinervis]|uniref:Uncharacterized protein n=1 Tax=Triparma retinervis TaxID=2557542 RepID=A0A9W7E159_9STRA|nr:hypothetical protein TrRE_jg10305 [Triparma retinervis]